MTPPGLTCGRCERALYPHLARTTDDGYAHAADCPRLCAIDGCEKPHKARGYCNRHYIAWKDHGNPLAGRTWELEDIEWMVQHGESLDGAAARVGLRPGSLADALRRQGRRDLCDRLIAQNPHDWNLITEAVVTRRRPPDYAAKKNARRRERRKVAA